jgi:hypothetical protein
MLSLISLKDLTRACGSVLSFNCCPIWRITASENFKHVQIAPFVPLEQTSTLHSPTESTHPRAVNESTILLCPSSEPYKHLSSIRRHVDLPEGRERKDYRLRPSDENSTKDPLGKLEH